jgi:phospholipid transport system substrate-binding protein
MGKALAAWLLVAAAAASQGGPPRDVVQGAVTRVIAIVSEEPDSAEHRREELRRIAADVFDFDEMARRALSRHWAARSKAEQAEFRELFTDLLERTYVSRLESYAGEKITYPTEVVDGNYATVRSRIVTRRSETALDYRLHLDGGRWRVFDISVDGVSFVSTYRSEFNRIIQASSYSSLLDRLRKKRIEIDALARRTDRTPPAAATR